MTGAAFRGGRLFLAGAQGTTYQVWSVNLATGARRLEVELKNVQGEAEGLHVTPLLGGRLHFLVAPLAAKPTFGPTVALLHFAPSRTAGPACERHRHAPRLAPSAREGARDAARPSRRGREGQRRGRSGATNANGVSTLWPPVDVPSSFAAVGRKGRLEGRSRFLALGPAPSASATASSVPLR